MGRPENKGGTEKQPQQVGLAKISLKKEPLCVGVDDEELPQWTDDAGQGCGTLVPFSKKCYFWGLPR